MGRIGWYAARWLTCTTVYYYIEPVKVKHFGLLRSGAATNAAMRQLVTWSQGSQVGPCGDARFRRDTWWERPRVALLIRNRQHHFGLPCRQVPIYRSAPLTAGSGSSSRGFAIMI